MIRWLREHPVPGFVLLAYGLSYLVGFPWLIAYLAWAPTDPSVLRTYISRLFVVFGPALAALISARLCGTPGAVASLLHRLVPRRSDLPWAALLLMLGGVASGMALLYSGATLNQLLTALDYGGGLLLAHWVLQITIVSIGEELGWRGWLLPRLLERTSRIRATLILAGIWGLWHGPLLLSGFHAATLFLLAVLGLSILFTWMWVHTGQRLFLIVLAHASANAPIFFWEEFSTDTGGAGALSAWYVLETTYVLGGALLLLITWRWWLVRPASPPDPLPDVASSPYAA